MTLKIDDQMEIQTDNFTPVLIAIVCNKLDIVRYFLEELHLSLPLSLHKPRDQAEYQVLDYISTHPEKSRDAIKLKKNNEKYHRIYSMVIACKNQNAPIMNYLLGNDFEASSD